MARSAVYETAWFEQLDQRVASRWDVSAHALLNTVRARLAQGAREYGDTNYLSADLIREAHEEAADLIAYALLETQKRLSDNATGMEHLMAAAELAAVADWHIRMAGRPDV